METKFTEQQSLEVITEMINRARNNVQKDSANNMIYNGFAVAFVAIANFILLHVLPDTYGYYLFSIAIVILLISIFGICFVSQNWIAALLITPVIMLITGLVEFGMAKICRYRPFFWGAVVFWSGSLLCMFTYCVLNQGDLHFLILAACMIAGFVIPGYQLNKSVKKNV
jgi:hypothetical protein